MDLHGHCVTPSVDVRRAGDRFATDIGWLDSKHSFSFGQHYDPDNTHFGLLLVNNDDVVAPGSGFETHPHRDMEIVTWVLRGQLVHQDSEGHNGLIYPGLAQRMSAGTGILHSEKNDSWRLTGDDEHEDPVHFVQMWVRARRGTAAAPGYEQLEIDDALLRGGLVPVASGRPRAQGRRRDLDRPASTPRCSPRRLAPGGVGERPGRAVRPPVRRRRCRRARGHRAAGHRRRRPHHRRRRPAGDRRADGAEVLVWEMHAGLAG